MQLVHICTVLVGLSLAVAVTGVTPGLKSKIFTLVSRSNDLVTNVTAIRCAQHCLRLGDYTCSYITINAKNRRCEFKKEKIGSRTGVNLEYKVTVWDGIVVKISSDVNYDEASTECRRLKGFLAPYEILVSAIKYGMNLTCDVCWLISGEVTFSNDQTMCELVSPDLRCNLYPDRAALYSCFYCYINSIIMPFGIDYHSDCRILHISYDSTQGYHYADAETRCRDEFNGHLALPMELYNVSVNGVKTCETAWFSDNLKSKAENAEICWENAITGNKFRNVDPSIYYKPAYCSLLNVEPGAYPYPDHGVIYVTPTDSSRNVLNYTQATERCTEIGGSLASPNQLEAANLAGYSQLKRSWIRDKYIAYSCVHGCSPLGVTVSKGQKLESNQYDAFCHIPKI